MTMMDALPTISLESLNTFLREEENRTLAAFYQAGVANYLPVALWRYPNHPEKHALVDFSGTAHSTKIDFTQKIPGFAFAPFVNEGGEATLFIKASLYLNQTGHHFYEESSTLDNLLVTNNKTRFLASYQHLASSSTYPGYTWITTEAGSEATPVCTEAQYCKLVEEAIDYIQSTGIKKVVTSRATETPLPPNFNPLATFEALCKRYPHAFISLVSIPAAGTWMGASPETLLSMKNNEIHTVALAGTQAYSPDVPLAQVTWGAKEIEEQALVSDYIRGFMQQLKLDHFTEDGPRTVSAGNVVHLRTKFKVSLDEPHLSHLANQILHKLHPTSAVCGMPQKEALSFILEKENYDRAFYSGFLGPVHLNQQSHLFVNLRCMQLKQDSAILYIGGGITQDSVPRAEWEETVLKSKTLLDVLQPEQNEISGDPTPLNSPANSEI